MTREEAIQRWSDIAETVFWAEERIAKAWNEKLRAAPDMTKEEKHLLAKQYCRSIAVEITKATSDEELAAMA
jgi:hypothetical protein